MAFAWQFAFPTDTPDVTFDDRTVTITSNNKGVVSSEFTGKKYWEISIDSPQQGILHGFGDISGTAPGLSADEGSGVGYFLLGQAIYQGGALVSAAPAVVAGDVISFAWDDSTGDYWIALNGAWIGDGGPDPATGTAPLSQWTVPAGSTSHVKSSTYLFRAQGDAVATGNWQENEFAYAIPSGFSPIGVVGPTAGQIALPLTVDVVPDGFRSGVALPIETNVVATGTATAAIAVSVSQTGEIGLPLTIAVPGTIPTRFAVDVQKTGTIATQIAIEVREPTGSLSLPFQITTTQTGTIGAGIQVSVFDSTQPHRCEWSATVTLDGVDVSSRLTGQISVSASEGAARVATFVLKPFAGAVDPNRWIGSRVVIDYIDADKINRRLFTGFVDTPRYDATARVTTFDCSDLLQNSLEGSSREQIDRLIGGYWSNLVFDDDADGWRYSQDQLSTIPAALDLTRFGAATISPFAAKSTPDFTFSADRVVNGSLGVSLVSRRELLNRIDLIAEYRFQRNWQGEKRFSWHFDNTLCQQLRDEGKTTPNRPMIESAISQTGWKTAFLDYTPPPSSRDVRCPGSNTVSYWAISDELRDYLVWGVRFVLAQRWRQSITEKYEITVQAPESIESVGVISREQRTGVQSESDDSFDQWETYESPKGEAYETGLFFSDADDRANAETALQAIIGRSRNDILKSHRSNTVSFDTLIQPEMERFHTARINSDAVTAQGKVREISHLLDIDSGIALSTIALAVSRKLGNQSASDSGNTLPSKPDAEYEKSGKYNSRLTSQYGGRYSSGEQQEIEGYSGNFEPGDLGAPKFDISFAFTVPAVDPSFTESQTPSEPATNTVAIPDDLLSMAA